MLKILAEGRIKTNKLFSDYVNGNSIIKDFYPLYFKDESAWNVIIDKVRHRNIDYSKIAKILENQNINLGASQITLDNIDKLATGKAFTIVTGQQATIFTGPLYTIYKALTAIRLSQYLSEKYQAEFIPIFWTESNDNDFEEANHIYLLDQNSDPLRLEYIPSQYKHGCSIKDIPIDNGFEEVINSLERNFHDTEFKKSIFDIIRESYTKSESLSNGFGRMMARLLGKYGLIMLDPSDPEMKSIMSPIFQREIEFPLKSVKIINSAGHSLESLGYESQIEKSEDSTCLFIEEDGIRRKIFFRNNCFEIDGINISLCKSELRETLEIAPYRFSPNVALRPIVQDYILPTVAYVAGPGEISYFAQLSGLYAHFNVNMPIIYPRASFAIVESKVQRAIEKNGLELSDLSEHYESLFSRISKEKVADKLESLIEPSREEIEKTLKELISKLSIVDRDLGNIAESVRKKIDQQISILKDKAYQVQRSRDDTLRDQIKRACMNIYPDGKPQERTFNIVQYLVLYGDNLIDEIMQKIIIKFRDCTITF